MYTNVRNICNKNTVWCKKNVITTCKLLINYMYVLLLHKTDVMLLIKIVSKLMGWVFLNIID